MFYANQTLVLLLAIITMLPQNSWSDTTVENMLSSYRVTAGVSVNSIDFDVGSEGNTNPYGTLSEEFSYTPYVVLGSPYRFLGKSNWGGMMEYSFSTFRLNHQLVNDELVNLGTSVKGYYAFITPAAFYSFFEKNAGEKLDHTLIAGMGIGIGYLKAEGDIIFTETTQQRHEINVSGTALAVSVFVDYRIGNITTRLSGGLTSHTKDNLDYDAFTFTWNFGYVFSL